jgi:hypothetical protein
MTFYFYKNFSAGGICFPLDLRKNGVVLYRYLSTLPCPEAADNPQDRAPS